MASFTQSTPTGSINGENVTFVLSTTPSSVEVYLDGLLMTDTVDFTRSGTTITFVTPPATGQALQAWTFIA